ncbi:MAG TPA: hypothetical protein VKR56_09950 [Candidatus Cybelea sp.]|nr:hypothetical protein [Candidatus Cybelea sp.]
MGKIASPTATPNSTPGPYTFYAINDPHSSSGDYNVFMQGEDEGTPGLTGLTVVGSWQPGGTLCPSNICGVSYKYGSSSSWTPITDPNQGAGPCAVTEVLAINDSLEGVGYYEKNVGGLDACSQQAFEYYTPEEGGSTVYLDINPTATPAGASTEATSINQLGDVVGTLTYTTGTGSKEKTVTEGWLYADLNYYGIPCPSLCSGDNLYATGVNFNHNVVGYYDNPNTSATPVTTGFFAKDPEASKGGFFVPIVDNADGNTGKYTAINAINDYCLIAGSARDSDFVLHGIIGYAPTKCNANTTMEGRNHHAKSPARPRS